MSGEVIKPGCSDRTAGYFMNKIYYPKWFSLKYHLLSAVLLRNYNEL